MWVALVSRIRILSAFGMETLRDLPDMEALEDAGLLDARIPLGNGFAAESPEEDEHAIALSGALSPYLHNMFPNNVRRIPTNPEDMSESDAADWRKKWLAFCKARRGTAGTSAHCARDTTNAASECAA